MLDLKLSTSHKSECRIRGERGALRQLGKWVEAVLPAPRRIVVVSDRNVAPFCLDTVEQSLTEAGFTTHAILVPPGEESKSLKTLGNVWDRLQYGAVADFINMSCCGLRNPFAFNLADAAIFGGAALLVLFGRAADRSAPRNRT